MNHGSATTTRKRREINEIITSIRLIKGVNQKYSRDLMKTHRITGQQLGALRIVSLSPFISLGDLSERMYLHISTGSGIVDRLEAKGYLTRERSRMDRRVVNLRITPLGRRVIKKAPLAGIGLLFQDIDHLPTNEIHRIWDAMMILRKVMNIDSNNNGKEQHRRPRSSATWIGGRNRIMADEKKESTARVAKTRRLHQRKRVLIPLVLLVIAAILATTYWYLYLRGYVATDDAYIDGDAITISSKILGRVTQLTVDEGDSVSQGQMLVKLDDSDLKAQEAQSIAGLEYSQQNVPVAKINLDRAQDDFDRASFQYKDKVITREQYDHARKALDMAQAQYKVALSQVNSSIAQLAVIETQLRNTQIMAPTTGVVAKKWIVPGDIVQAGQPILTLFDLDSVWVTANFEETKLGSDWPGRFSANISGCVPGQRVYRQGGADRRRRGVTVLAHSPE